MASVRRQKKIAEFIHKEISNLIQFQIKDPRIGFITVTDVEINPDLSNAKIYVSIFSEDEAEVLAGLRSAAPYLRRELGRNMYIRHIPSLEFHIDHSLAYAQEIETLLSQIDIPPEPEDPDELNDQSGGF